jgi:hypothetical protein
MKILLIPYSLKIYFTVLICTFFLGSCWAPRCPIQNCKSKYEHKHTFIVSGYFSTRKPSIPTFHFIWDKKKANVETMKLETQPKNGKQGTIKRAKKIKLFPWEKGYN